MKNFFGAFFGSCLGILVTGFVVTIVVIVSITSSFKDALSKNNDETYVAVENSVLKINLNNLLFFHNKNIFHLI